MRIALILAALTLTLSGCGENGIDGIPLFREENIALKDGRTVNCVVFQSINEGGIDCDWNNAK